MLTLYHSPMSRSSRFVWMLEELGEPYDIKYVTIQRHDGSGARDPANVHPEGKVPALMHDGQLVLESGAIALYLSDSFPEAKLGPAVGDPKRGEYLKWLFYYAAEVEPLMMARVMGQGDNPMHVRSYEQMTARLNQALSTGPYILGEDFSAADVLFGSAFMYIRNVFPDDPAIDRYTERLAARPALKASQARENP